MFLKLYALLYADDTIVLAESADDLQKALNSLHNYCNLWHIKVNASKTKIVVEKSELNQYLLMEMMRYLYVMIILSVCIVELAYF